MPYFWSPFSSKTKFGGIKHVLVTTCYSHSCLFPLGVMQEEIQRKTGYIVMRDDGTFDVDANTSIDQLSEELNIKIPEVCKFYSHAGSFHLWRTLDAINKLPSSQSDKFKSCCYLSLIPFWILWKLHVWNYGRMNIANAVHW